MWSLLPSLLPFRKNFVRSKGLPARKRSRSACFRIWARNRKSRITRQTIETFPSWTDTGDLRRVRIDDAHGGVAVRVFAAVAAAVDGSGDHDADRDGGHHSEHDGEHHGERYGAQDEGHR